MARCLGKLFNRQGSAKMSLASQGWLFLSLLCSMLSIYQSEPVDYGFEYPCLSKWLLIGGLVVGVLLIKPKFWSISCRDKYIRSSTVFTIVCSKVDTTCFTIPFLQGSNVLVGSAPICLAYALVIRLKDFTSLWDTTYWILG